MTVSSAAALGTLETLTAHTFSLSEEHHISHKGENGNKPEV